MNKTTIKTITTGVAILKELNSIDIREWKIKTEDRDDSFTLLTEGGKFSLWFRYGGYGNEGRIKICYNRPRSSKGDHVSVWADFGGGQIHDPSITVAQGRSAKQIASDIARRLLPEAEFVHRKVMTSIKSHDEYDAKKQLLNNKVAALLGSTPVDAHSYDPFDNLRGRGDFSGGYGTVKVSGDNIDIDLRSIPAAMATDMLNAIRAVYGQHKLARVGA